MSFGCKLHKRGGGGNKPLKSPARFKNPMDFFGKIKILHSHPCFSMSVLFLVSIQALL